MCRTTLCSLLLGLGLPAMIWGQGLSTINGTVTDPSGGVVPGANITVKEVDTSLVRTTVSNADGLYVLSALRPTRYTLTVEASGFRNASQTGILLQVNESVTINVKLELGSASQAVTVEASPVQVDISTSTVKQVIDSTRVREMPLQGRNAAELTTLVPGAVIFAAGGAPGNGADEGLTKSFPVVIPVSTNGGRSNQVSYFLDGVTNTDFLSNVNLPFPMPDTIQEFSVQTTNYNAEYGQSNGAVVNIVTKSGTNEFHGDVFDYARNAVFNARNFFASAVDPLKRHQFGGVIGGPLKRDKAFFFFGYQGTRLRDVAGGLSAHVPTPADVSGDFSAFLTASNPNNPSGQASVLKDPLTGQPFLNNQIPVSRFDPASLALLNWLPSAGGNGLVFYNKPLIQNSNEYTVKGDYDISKNDRLTLRYFRDSSDNPAVLANHNLLTYSDYAEYLVHNAAVQETTSSARAC